MEKPLNAYTRGDAQRFIVPCQYCDAMVERANNRSNATCWDCKQKQKITNALRQKERDRLKLKEREGKGSAHSVKKVASRKDSDNLRGRS